VGEFEIKELTLHAYYCKGSLQSTLYEDQGDGYQYLQGQYLYRTFETKGTDNSFELNQRVEGDYTSTYVHYRLIMHGIPFKVKNIIVDGTEVTFDMMNPEMNIIECQLPVHFKTLIIK
jgi:alpha-glucosidase